MTYDGVCCHVLHSRPGSVREKLAPAVPRCFHMPQARFLHLVKHLAAGLFETWEPAQAHHVEHACHTAICVESCVGEASRFPR
jgi:hypothetical protein